ncbi:MAG: DegV family protein [Dehalococcoidia bacterium]
MALRIVTDSSCDLPAAVIRSLDITIVPCYIHFGDELLRDGVDIQPSKFYQRLGSGGVHPTTSQPSVGDFLQVYQDLTAEGDEVLSVHISSKLSGTYNSAVQARKELPERPRIEVVDSLQVSLGLGIAAKAVAELARADGSMEQARAFLERELPRIVCYVSVDTLGYLVRGGRASRIQGFLGSLLNIKPIIVVRDGETHPVDRVRSRKRLLARFQQIILSCSPVRTLGFLHSACPDEAQLLADRSSADFPDAEVLISEFTPVLGVHLGPRALGISIWSDAESES